MREASLENYAYKKIKAVGGKALKWICPGLNGAPDRICIFPGGRIIFAEFKRPGLKDGMSVKQKKVCRMLENLGCDVRRIGNKEDFQNLMEDLGYEV